MNYEHELRLPPTAEAFAVQGFRNPLAQGWAWCVEAEQRNAVEWRSPNFQLPVVLFQEFAVENNTRCFQF